MNTAPYIWSYYNIQAVSPLILSIDTHTVKVQLVTLEDLEQQILGQLAQRESSAAFVTVNAAVA